MSAITPLLDALSLADARSYACRRQCWREGVPQALGERAPEGAAAALVDALAEVIEVYGDSRSSHEWLLSLSAVASRDDIGASVVNTMLSRLLALAQARQTPSAQLLTLRGLSRLFVANYGAANECAAARKGGIAEVVLCMGTLLHGIQQHSRRATLARAGAAAVRSVLLASKQAAGVFAKVLFAVESPGVEAAALAGVILDARAQVPIHPSARDQWIALYVAAVLGPNTPPPPASHRAFVPLLATASEEEWTGKLLPAALRALKRTPDAAVENLSRCATWMEPEPPRSP